MSTITWIIIVLIVVSIAVTVSEVALRFGILSKEKAEKGQLLDKWVEISRKLISQPHSWRLYAGRKSWVKLLQIPKQRFLLLFDYA